MPEFAPLIYDIDDMRVVWKVSDVNMKIINYFAKKKGTYYYFDGLQGSSLELQGDCVGE